MATGIYLLVMLIFALMFAGGLYLALRKPQGQISEGRRAFLGGGGGSSEPHALFFGLQIAIQIFGSDDLRRQLQQLINAEDETDSAQEKRKFIKSIAALLIENQYAWEFGFWEYYNDSETAISSFNQWRNEVEASMATEAAEMGAESDRLHRFSDQKEFLLVTIIMLLDNRDEPVADDVGEYAFRPTYAQLAAPFKNVAEGFDEKEFWTAATFARLLDGVRALDPRCIERDGIYVYPGTEQDGLSTMDLISDAGWKYLTDHAFRY